MVVSTRGSPRKVEESAELRQRRPRSSSAAKAAVSSPAAAKEGPAAEAPAADGAEGEGSTILAIVRHRTPWLLLFLGGLLLCAKVMHNFEAILERELELAYFVPMLIGHGGNSGGQSSAHHIRTLDRAGRGNVRLSQVLRCARTEGCAGLVQGLLLTCAVGPCLRLVMGTSLRVLAVVCITIPTLSVFANSLGAILPFAVTRLGADPAVIVGPLMTTSIDTVGLAIYLTVATALISVTAA